MLLSREKAELFFKVHGALMQLVAGQLKVLSDPGGPAVHSSLPPAERRKVV